MKKQTVKEFLAEYGNKNEWGDDEETLIEILVEANTVWEGKDDQHRWYIWRPVVKEIEGTYISFYEYVITGDNSASDMGLEYELDNAGIVERKERQITEIYYE